jgi:hypothetical protein
MPSKHPFSLRGLMVAGAAAIGLAGAPPAQAGLVNVDFNTGDPSATYSGAAVTGAAGDVWNGINGGTLGSPLDGSNLPLVDATGANSGVALSFSGTSGAYDSTGNGCLMSATSFAPLMCDYIYRFTGEVATLTLSGLTPGAAYDLILYAMANEEGRVTDYTVDGVTKSVTAGAASGLVLSTNYTEFTGTVAANGVLSFTFGGPSEGNLDGLQLTQTVTTHPLPEPATLALLGLGLAAAGYQRRKR